LEVIQFFAHHIRIWPSGAYLRECSTKRKYITSSDRTSTLPILCSFKKILKNLTRCLEQEEEEEEEGEECIDLPLVPREVIGDACLHILQMI
jgi:hypothetical protein